VNELQLLSNVTRMLNSVTSVSEVKDLRDKAEAVRQYYKASKKGLEAQNQAAFVKLMCERRGGELLLQVDRAERIKGKGLRAMLAHTDIPESTARRWQYLAQFPEANLREIVAICNEEQDELTTARVVMEARGYLDQLESRKAAAEAKSAAKSTPDAPDVDACAECVDEDDSEPPSYVAPVAREPDRANEPQAPVRRIDGEALSVLLELFAQARNVCELYPELSSMAGTLRRWTTDLTRKQGGAR
jgi:hypothetical protein